MVGRRSRRASLGASPATLAGLGSLGTAAARGAEVRGAEADYSPEAPATAGLSPAVRGLRARRKRLLPWTGTKLFHEEKLKIEINFQKSWDNIIFLEEEKNIFLKIIYKKYHAWWFVRKYYQHHQRDQRRW